MTISIIVGVILGVASHFLFSRIRYGAPKRRPINLPTLGGESPSEDHDGEYDNRRDVS
tara:strand:- start:373 stop:546 length:174 start_codon:yes stop_codon:yes gene_type:complete